MLGGCAISTRPSENTPIVKFHVLIDIFGTHLSCQIMAFSHRTSLIRPASCPGRPPKRIRICRSVSSVLPGKFGKIMHGREGAWEPSGRVQEWSGPPDRRDVWEPRGEPGKTSLANRERLIPSPIVIQVEIRHRNREKSINGLFMSEYHFCRTPGCRLQTPSLREI